MRKNGYSREGSLQSIICYNMRKKRETFFLAKEIKQTSFGVTWDMHEMEEFHETSCSKTCEECEKLTFLEKSGESLYTKTGSEYQVAVNVRNV